MGMSAMGATCWRGRHCCRAGRLSALPFPTRRGPVLFSWLAGRLSRRLQPSQRAKRPKAYRRLHLESLEQRDLLAAFTNGNVLLGFNNGLIEEHRPDGTLVQSVNTGQSGARGMAFD